MAENKIELEIVTPRGRALATTADEVTAPSIDGEFGVLPGHLPLLATLRTGIVTYRQSGEVKRCAVGRGFAEAGPDRLVILTDHYIERKDVDPVVVRKELAAVQAEMAKVEASAPLTPDHTPAAGAAYAEQLRALIVKENWLAAQLELYGDPPPATMRPFEEFGPPPPLPDTDVPPPENGAS